MNEPIDWVHCCISDCTAVVADFKWSKIKAGAWFFGKDGKAYCPDHLPEWVEPWREQQAKKKDSTPRFHCRFCGDEIFLFNSVSFNSEWRHTDTYDKYCYERHEAAPEVYRAKVQEAQEESVQASDPS